MASVIDDRQRLSVLRVDDDHCLKPMPYLRFLQGRAYATKASAAPRLRLHKYARRLAIIGAVGGVTYVVDKEVNAQALVRSLRTAWMG